MPLRDINLFGLLVSPIFLLVAAAIVLTLAFGKMAELALPHSLRRLESLMNITLFVGLLAAMVSYIF